MSLPSSLMISGVQAVDLSRVTASSPACVSSSSISSCARLTNSSMLAGWMRPSLTSASRAVCAISRRTGSNDESSTSWGDSSISSVTPVAASNALMLRPSRPMIRPFISSLGSCTRVAVRSLFGLLAIRCMEAMQDAPRLRLQLLLGLLERLAPQRPQLVLALEEHLLAQLPA